MEEYSLEGGGVTWEGLSSPVEEYSVEGGGVTWEGLPSPVKEDSIEDDGDSSLTREGLYPPAEE